MKRIILLLLLLASHFVSANDFDIEVMPKEPILGENFNVVFKVKTSSSNTPDIQFEPKGVQVLEKNFIGRSTRTTFFNGKLLSETTLNFQYEMTPEKTGNVYLKKIKVIVDGKEITKPDLRIRILKKPKIQAPIMLTAEPSKERVFLGESVIVNYYVYYRVSLQNFTIKKFPKLDKMLKRYQPEQTRVERVSVGNQMYQRRLLYSAQVFPEKKGKLKIDSMSLKVHYAVRENNPFSGLGFNIGSRNLKSRTVNSETVYLEVLPLPTEGMPKNFTGLVGKHDFSLNINKTKFLLNEPMEIKLKITGPGALENIDAPSLIESASLEEFDVKSDLELSQNFSGTKTFEYVFLTRAPLKTEARQIELAYFNPENLKYEKQSLTLPAIEVIGQAVATSDANSKAVSSTTKTEFSDNGTTLMAPLESALPFFTLKRINIGLLVFVLFLFAYKNKGLLKGFQVSKKKQVLKDALHGNITYQKLIELLKVYNQDFQSFKSFVTTSDLDGSTREYLMGLLSEIEKAEFAPRGEKKKVKIKKKYLKKLISLLER